MQYFHKFEDFLVKRFAWKIIAVSEATKKDFMKFMNDDGSRISVVHHGYESQGTGYRGQGTEKQSVILDRLPEKYIAFLATLQPRKNISGLIAAMRMLRNEHPEIQHKLVIAGKPGWKSDPILKEINDNKDIVVYVGRVSDDDRFEILRRADCLVLPSFYEGFGMQLLEAYEVGTPVITSNNSSLPEVAGPGALYVDPNNTTEIKNAIKQLILDRGLHDMLAIKGAEHLKSFSWEKCAQETHAVLIS